MNAEDARINYTVKELLLAQDKQIKELHNKLDDIYTQTKLTNGRVNSLEPRMTAVEEKVSKIDLKLAYYTGAIAIIVIIAQYALQHISL